MAKVKLLNPNDSGRMLDRYELMGEIASGGMATVFLARLAGVGGFQRFVAIKRLHPHLANEEDCIQMFLDEARLAAGIHHPHVVPILEVGTSPSGYYLVMEYIEGDTLARLLARAASQHTPIPRPVMIRIILDALSGLHEAHELRDANDEPIHLVHRDVSPQNILVGVDGCTRITDFGVARAAARLTSTRAGQMKGKLAYMAPEQTRGEDVDRRADVFAMGIILWETFAGRRLFKAHTEAATMARVLSGPIPPLGELVPDIEPELEAVCLKALARDVNDRYQSAAEMADALERAGRLPTIGIASPRETASYVQMVIGNDIATQRESVRVWLAQSESSLPERSRGSLLRSSAQLPLVEVAALPPVPVDRASVAEPDSLSVPVSSSTPPPTLRAVEDYADLTVPKRSRAGAWATLALLLLGVAGLSLWVARASLFPGADRPALAASAAPVAAPVETVSVAAQPPAGLVLADTEISDAEPAASASASGPASVAASASAAPAAAAPFRPRPRVRPPVAPAGSATAAPPREDFSNPYR